MDDHTKVLWIPYIVNRIGVRGSGDAVALTFKVPLVRTLSFFISFGARMVFVWTLLTA
ncbi:hypothetical protein [Marinobacter sp.]|uniref:hypothetical protein n=1 Tax=Marinobacter sp. TaxID=50741 RepID=UPI002B4A3365|nr:hypothetical protein [Marinobacter sp.]HKK56620.1 hypothetical protein [Marinobacter sp.]